MSRKIYMIRDKQFATCEYQDVIRITLIVDGKSYEFSSFLAISKIDNILAELA